MNKTSGPDGFWARLAGQQRTVHVAGSCDDAAIGGQTVTGGNGDVHAGFQIAGGEMAAAAAGGDDGGAVSRQGHQLRDGRSRPGPHQVVEIAPGEQEEEQRHGGIEIGVFGAVDGLEQAHEGGQQHA